MMIYTLTIGIDEENEEVEFIKEEQYEVDKPLPVVTADVAAVEKDDEDIIMKMLRLGSNVVGKA